MRGRRVILISVLAAMLMTCKMFAQDDAEFRMEIGGGLGSSFYMGDVNNTMYKNQQIAVTGLWRYLFDHYNTLKVHLTYAGLKGQGTVSEDYIPENYQSGKAATSPYLYKFSGAVIDLDCMYELNLWPYGYYAGYMGYKRFTPYLQFGLGMDYGTKAKTVSANIPIGFGLKYRLGKRVNLSFDWAMHFGLTDKLDGISDPHGVSSEAFKNKDNYCTTMVTLTYSFAPICPTCNKAN